MARVMVVEDNPVNMKLALLLLHKFGHTVLCAGDGESALLLARAELPDLILMDYQLPGMDGFTATGILKQDPATAAIPVIAITALAINISAANSPHQYCDAYLAKPLRYQELYAMLETFLGVQQGLLHSEPGDLYRMNTITAQDFGTGTAPFNPATSVDVSVLAGLVGNDPDVIREFLAAFRVSAATIAGALKVACVARQPLVAGKLAHQLRSAGCAVGALQLGELCAAMEREGAGGRTEQLVPLMARLESELLAVNSFVETFMTMGAPV